MTLDICIMDGEQARLEVYTGRVQPHTRWGGQLSTGGRPRIIMTIRTTFLAAQMDVARARREVSGIDSQRNYDQQVWRMDSLQTNIDFVRKPDPRKQRGRRSTRADPETGSLVVNCLPNGGLGTWHLSASRQFVRMYHMAREALDQRGKQIVIERS